MIKPIKIRFPKRRPLTTVLGLALDGGRLEGAVVRRTIEAGKPGGGYVIMATASPINADLSPVTERNYRIFIETALEFGRYA